MSEAAQAQHSFLPFAPVMTKEQWENGVGMLNDWIPIHRLALFVLTHDSQSLSDLVQDEEGANHFLDLAEELDRFQKWRKHDDEMIASALARLLAVLTDKAGMVIADA